MRYCGLRVFLSVDWFWNIASQKLRNRIFPASSHSQLVLNLVFPALAGFQRESRVGKYEDVTLNVTRTLHENNSDWGVFALSWRHLKEFWVEELLDTFLEHTKMPGRSRETWFFASKCWVNQPKQLFWRQLLKQAEIRLGECETTTNRRSRPASPRG